LNTIDTGPFSNLLGDNGVKVEGSFLKQPKLARPADNTPKAAVPVLTGGGLGRTNGAS
jgi:hypothetical protein